MPLTAKGRTVAIVVVAVLAVCLCQERLWACSQLADLAGQDERVVSELRRSLRAADGLDGAPDDGLSQSVRAARAIVRDPDGRVRSASAWYDVAGSVADVRKARRTVMADRVVLDTLDDAIGRSLARQAPHQG